MLLTIKTNRVYAVFFYFSFLLRKTKITKTNVIYISFVQNINGKKKKKKEISSFIITFEKKIIINK